MTHSEQIRRKLMESRDYPHGFFDELHRRLTIIAAFRKGKRHELRQN